MEFRKVLALRGPNIWAHFPVLEAWIDLGPLKESASDELSGFNERLMRWLPTLIEHRCSVGTRGGFFERLRRGTYQAHILEHVALELQSLAGTEVGFGRTRETSEEGVYKVAVRYEVEELGRASLEAARRLCLAAVHDHPFDVEAELAGLRELARCTRPDGGTALVLQAARQRRLPVRQLTPEGLLRLGQGVKARRFLAGQTDATGALAESVAHDNELARFLLRGVGVPVPEGRPVGDAEDAWAAAEELGLPVTLRRRYGNDPAAVRRELRNRDEVLAAHEELGRDGYSLLLERWVPGQEWRLLVAGGRVVAGQDVHPEVAARAVEAVGAVGLDVAGVDVSAADLARPLEEQGGVVTGLDPRPDLARHGLPAAEALLAQMFPAGQTGRIPVVAVTGVNGKTTTTRLIAHLVGRAGLCVGMTCTEGIYVDGRRIEVGDCSGPWSAGAVLGNPRVEAAVLETARGGILRAGLGFDACDVAVVTNLGEGDHLGVADIDTLEQLARVKRTIVDVVLPGGAAVLKADDPLVAEMAGACRGGVVFFSRNPDDPVIARHRAAQGRAVFVRDERIVLAEGTQEIPLVALERVPLTGVGRVGFQVENALAAAAAAWSLGIPCEVILAGLESFAADLEQTPARFNLVEINGATAVFDYGHNSSSLLSLIEALAQLPHAYRSVLYTAAGDRRDADLVRQGELLGDAFDRVILYEEEHCTRGRADGEIIALFRRGLAGRRRVKKIEEVRGALKAVEATLASARPGELLLVQVDLVDETMDLIRRHLAAVGGRQIDFAEALGLARAELAEVS
jgi:cyanophycin synthetase